MTLCKDPCVFYDSLTHVLDTIDASRRPDGRWHSFRDEDFSNQNQAIDNPPRDDWAESLSEFMGYCRNFDAPYLTDRIKRIAELTDELDACGLEASSVKRRQVWTRQGSRINPHRVLRGQLSTAWRRTVREQASSTQGRIVVVLALAYSAMTKTEHICWNTAATLALVALAKQAGRMVTLYGVHHSNAIYEQYPTFTLCIPLLASDDIWSIHSTTLTTSSAFCRRICFRLLEIGQPRHGPIYTPYGWPSSGKELRHWVDTTLAQHTGVPPTACYVGPVQEQHITSLAAARAWLESQLEKLNS